MGAPQTIDRDEPRRGRPAVWAAAGAVALIVAVLLGYSLITGPSEPPQVGKPVPAFQLAAFDGSSMILGNPQGQVVVVNFFASWCNPCREEAADLERTWQQYRERGVQFYAIAYKDAGSKAQAFLDEFAVSFPGGLDPGSRVSRAYGVTGVPETFVIDRQGRLTRHFLGAVTNAALAAELESALAR